MNVPVVWVSFHRPEIIARGYWDQGLLEDIFARKVWRPREAVTFTHHDGFHDLPASEVGAVVVIPAQHHASDTDVDRINLELARLDWCVVILTGDEESLFDHSRLDHEAMWLWVQNPRTNADDPERFVPYGYPPGAPELLATASGDKSIPWFFAGQVTHSRRRECTDALKRLAPQTFGILVETEGFAQGWDTGRYLGAMAAAQVVPCPSGPHTADSFRLWEALEAGCIPLVDARVPGGPEGSIDVELFWRIFAPGPFPLMQDWDNVSWLVPTLLESKFPGETWAGDAAACSAWWQQFKRSIALRLERDVRALASGESWGRDYPEPEDRITVVITTSPIPSHPSTAVIAETVESIRAQPDLADAEILILADGVRPEQRDRTGDYHEYLRRLCWLTEHRWHNVVPFISTRHRHQAGLLREHLHLIESPLMLFVEHDTPLLGEIPWRDLGDVIAIAGANVVRLAHEAQILEPHRHMMLDAVPTEFAGVPVVRTRQWSQRPHLARTNYYREVMGTYFGADSRTMIEDVMHGVVDQSVLADGELGWWQHAVVIYHPPGDIKRSTHLDGRADDPKFDMVYAYDGPTPIGAPRATAERVD